MGLLKTITNRVLGTKSKSEVSNQEKSALLRRCYFEVMEQRRVLTANSVVAGVTFLEGDNGQDTTPDHFEVTFEGGAETTQLTQFTINGDQDSSGGFTDGDVFFDANDQFPGTAGSHGFVFDAENSSGITEGDIRSFSVSDDGLLLTVEVDNFDAGDIFAFTIDVDEVEGFRVDEIASGVEFEGSFFEAQFVDENYTFVDRDVSVTADLEEGVPQDQSEGIFFDEYNDLFDEGELISQGELDLTRDNEEGNSDRTAAAVDVFDLVVRPVTISGNVFHDENIDCVHDADSGEEGIEGVTITLQQINEQTGEYEDVATTTTDANGRYEFGQDLNLQPGTFRLIETQPEGYLNVGEVAGSNGGVTSENVIADINIPDGGTAATDYNFKEVRPASLEGNVFHDENDDGVFDANEEGIANVLIQVTRVSAKDGVTNDVFADSEPIFVRTDANGHYQVDALPPGIYEIVEINESGAEVDPLAAFIDGRDSVGNVNGTTVGSRSNDRFTEVVLCPDDHGVEYNFGEVTPAELRGTVYHDLNNNGVIESGEDRLGGVVIELFDKQGNLVAETQTDANGDYVFGNLRAGDYVIRESQPAVFTDGIDTLGEVNGVTSGEHTGNDEFCVTLEAGDLGTNYDFGELLPSSISGSVILDVNGDGVHSLADGDTPIEGVEIQLLDESGNLLDSTLTDENGDYRFDNLDPGTYSVRQVQPEGFTDGVDLIGQVDGETRGVLATNDVFSAITLESGDQAVDYDFCELHTASISGSVIVDVNGDGVHSLADGDTPIEGVEIVLLDESGNELARTLTDGNGDYTFDNLAAGTYSVAEVQPDGFFDGVELLGTVDGETRGVLSTNDVFSAITLEAGDQAVDYDFCELHSASISGSVIADVNGDGVHSLADGDTPIEGVEIVLLNADGNEIARTVTDENGDYTFQNLAPGTYSVAEVQPDGFFDGAELLGTIDGETRGVLSTNDVFTAITLEAGDQAVDYDFCELLPAEIHGRVFQDGPAFVTTDGTLPDDFRSQRDGIFQQSTDTPIEGVRLELFYFIDPTSGDINPRPVTLGEVQSEFYAHLGTDDPNAQIFVETDANGEYWFAGLQAGNYIVLESQPDGFFDSNDTAGTTTGFTFNSEAATQTASGGLLTFTGEELMDAVVNIRVNSGGISEANNFSEVTVQMAVTPPPTPNPPTPSPLPPAPTPPPTPTPPSVGITSFSGLSGSQPTSFTQFIGNSRGASFQTQASVEPFTWHLSVVNGGLPRGLEDGAGGDSAWQQAGYISNTDWSRFDMDDAVWTFTETQGEDQDIVRTSNSLRFGMLGGTPLAGDFDGDGTDEVAVFKDGYWMIDINRNGKWDETDLLARLGDVEDRPVVGDWDGDGKDDIGIYGPMWDRDHEAIDREPGLPNPENSPYTKPKNVPPSENDAADGARVMKLTSFGKQRVDVVDHVFGVGEGDEIPVTGDWNGNGIRSIGTFRDGVWELDVNGDGRFDYDDATVRFGQAGDVPVVGDFNGDGVEEIAIYRSGSWMIDSNGNRELDATDKTFQMGGAADKPVVGDWDGDGIDEPGLYSEGQSNSVYE